MKAKEAKDFGQENDDFSAVVSCFNSRLASLTQSVRSSDLNDQELLAGGAFSVFATVTIWVYIL